LEDPRGGPYRFSKRLLLNGVPPMPRPSPSSPHLDFISRDARQAAPASLSHFAFGALQRPPPLCFWRVAARVLAPRFLPTGNLVPASQSVFRPRSSPKTNLGFNAAGRLLAALFQTFLIIFSSLGCPTFPHDLFFSLRFSVCPPQATKLYVFCPLLPYHSLPISQPYPVNRRTSLTLLVLLLYIPI